LDEELFISSATLSEYLIEAELADSMARGAGNEIDSDTEIGELEMESDAHASSQENTLPEQLDEDDKARYEKDEERDEERAERDDPD